MAYDFPNAPTVGQIANGYIWDGEKWLSAGAPGPVVAVKKNYVTNGAMMVSQEFGTAATSANGYTLDMWTFVPVATTGAFSAQQIASRTPGGSPNRLRITVTTADAAVAAGDSVRIQHPFEGTRFADLKAGTAAAKTVTIQFGVKAPAGTYCVAMWNSAVNMSYIAEYVIATGEANTDVVRSVTIPLATTGTWATDTGPAGYVFWCLMAGTTFQGAKDTWLGPQLLGTANQFNFYGSVGNVFELFDVSLTEGPTAPPFVVPDIASELALCQRYWCSGFYSFNGYGNTYISHTAYFPMTMRGGPTVTATNAGGSASVGAATVQYVNLRTCEIYHGVSAPGVVAVTVNWKANARL